MNSGSSALYGTGGEELTVY
jgi:hypothetical protein